VVWGNKTMMSNTINFDHILLDVGAPNKKQMFTNISNALSKKTGFSEEKLLVKFVSQEEKESSAIGNGVAISHLHFSELSQPEIILCRLKNNSEFTTPDNLPVDLLCIVMSPKENTGRGLQIVSSLSRIMSDPFLCDQLRCLRSEEDIYGVMSERQIIRRAA
jgi:PTS system nitrogen regulatory IIA component